MTGTPAYLYYLFAVLMFAVSASSAVRLAGSVTGSHRMGWDLDLLHLFRGISMAGMFVPRWAFGANVVWESVFAVFLVWFVFMSVQSFRAFGIHLSHYLVHGVMSLAMLLMYFYGAGGLSRSPAVSSMSMSMSSGGHAAQSWLLLLLAVLLLISAVRTLGTGERGRSHHGAHPPVYSDPAVSDSGDVLVAERTATTTVARVGPLVEDAEHVVMCIAMAFMLILML